MDEDVVLDLAAVAVCVDEHVRQQQEAVVKKRRMWQSHIFKSRDTVGAGSLLLLELRETDHFRFNNFMRMTPGEFEELLYKVGPGITKQTTNMREPINAQTRLCATLRYLATGECLQSLEYLFRIAHNTLSYIVEETVKEIIQVMASDFLKFPGSVDAWHHIASDFYELWQFPALGAVDGKHVEIIAPTGGGSLYYNYKNRHSIVLMAIVDARYRFIYIDVGANGRASDGGIWGRCQLSQDLENKRINLPGPVMLPGSNKVVPLCFVADDAFPLKSYMMKPFSHSELQVEEQVLNSRVSRARRVVENAFGIWSKRFLIFKKAIELHPEKVIRIVIATCCLHNYLSYDDEETIEWQSENEIIQLEIRPNVVCSSNPNTIRTTYKDYVNNEGALPDQRNDIYEDEPLIF